MMDQQKIGQFLRTLRKDKQLTQAQLAEMLGVSNRTVSRWETGVNMPDFDLLIEMADFYQVEVRDILEGAVSQQRHDMQLAADYTHQEKQQRARVVRRFFIAGLAAVFAMLALEDIAGENVENLLLGVVTGVLLLGLMYTTRAMDRAQAVKRRLFSARKSGREDPHD